MSDAQRKELQGHVEGLVYGYLRDTDEFSSKDEREISYNAGAYVVGLLRGVVVTK